MLMVPPTAPTGVLRFEWVDPSGVVRDLTGETSPHRFVSAWPSGLGAAAVTLGLDKLPFAGGSLLRRVSTQPARIDLPITIVEDTLSNLIQTVDDLRGWFDTGDERGSTPGYLRVTREDDTIRQIASYYNGGLEGESWQGPFNAITYLVSLLAPDPWPTEQDNTVLSYDTGDLPDVVMINQGQLEAYPVWTFTGPFGSILVENTTTGQSWELIVALTSGLQLIVDTRPPNQRSNRPAYTTPGNVNLFQYFSPTSELFWLAAGENRISITFSGSPAVSGVTAVELSYRARYRGMLR